MTPVMLSRWRYPSRSPSVEVDRRPGRCMCRRYHAPPRRAKFGGGVGWGRSRGGPRWRRFPGPKRRPSMASDKGPSEKPTATEATNFIRDVVDRDLASGRVSRVVTRFPPSPTATCTSATPSRSASTSASRATTRAPATCASTTPTPPPRTWSTSSPSSATSAGWASTGRTSSSSPRTTTSGSTRTRVTAHPRRQGLRVQPERGGDPQVPRHRLRARRPQPLPRAHRRGEPRSVRAHAQGRVRRRRPRAARPRSTWRAPT